MKDAREMFQKLSLGYSPFSTGYQQVFIKKFIIFAASNKIRNEGMRKLNIMELGRMSSEEFRKAEKIPLVVVLDEVRSMNNIGSVFRTSDAFRVEAVYLCGITATPPHADIHKTALGAEDSVDWRYFSDTLDAVDELRKSGYVVYSVEQVEGSILLQDVQLDCAQKYAVILGNEVKGVKQEVVSASDGCIEIPQYGTKHSLNVSVTAGIVLWEMFQKLKLAVLH